MTFNYSSMVSDLCKKLTDSDKEFSAYDITKALRDYSNQSYAPQTIYHSIVRGEVHKYMKTNLDYEGVVSDNGAYTIYKPIVVNKTVTSGFLTTVGSFPDPLSGQTHSNKSTTLNKGMNGKFTVPKVMLNDAIRINNRTITVKFMTGGKVTSQKVYEIDKSNNIRFRLQCNKVIVQKTSSPTILVVRSN